MLAAVWLGPLPALAETSFAAHMVIHVSVVAIAAPLLAIGAAGGRFDPVRRAPVLLAAVSAPLLELVVVWSWHAPALHRAARASLGGFALEQASFLIAGLAVWLAAFGGDSAARRERAAAGMIGLLLTSMHMTLLGALLGLGTRPLYHTSEIHEGAGGLGGLDAGGVGGLDRLADQQLGGALMLLAGGLPYLAGGLVLARSLLRDEAGGVMRRLARIRGGAER